MTSKIYIYTQYLVTARDLKGYQFRQVVTAKNPYEAEDIVSDMPKVSYIINIEELKC